MPDGTVHFRDLSPNLMDLKMQINDMIIFEYHNNNGVTKSSFRLSEALIKENDKVNPMRKYLKNHEGNWPVGISLKSSKSWLLKD